jgi:hypothetical protein
MWWHTTTIRSTWQYIRRGARLTLLQLTGLGAEAARGRIALGRLNQMLQQLPALHRPRLPPRLAGSLVFSGSANVNLLRKGVFRSGSGTERISASRQIDARCSSPDLNGARSTN